ncbi:hypothetical protein PRIPAC_86115 [Pristionchus pacificus]|uniref:Uncharacterized protein n=1 Tax=Pristionchus pacificus TaxID=54126 RepID=A0A2A6BLD8_PRIPA|nr:hypothetical protein PRIPAC_86115 [Pristionchus pacificus]|eukprot:PDM66707.1 hypothetical protein PRIPAC_48124 [Pristionchus pacificus]
MRGRANETKFSFKVRGGKQKGRMKGSRVGKMSAIVKKCCNCRCDLPSGSSTVQCEKCQKNEAKYGKASTCKYCQLPAAFHEGKCVHCAHGERKNGPPIACAQCKLKAAFPRDQRDKMKGTTLCRMCIMQKQSAKPGTSSSSSKPSSSGVNISSTSKRRHSSTSKKDDSTAKMSKKEPEGNNDNVILVHKLKDEVESLKRELLKKDAAMIEKDKKIASLSADLMSSEKRSREQVARITKNHKEEIEMLHNQHKQTTRQMSQQLSEMNRSTRKERNPLPAMPLTSFHPTNGAKIKAEKEKIEKEKERVKEEEKALKEKAKEEKESSSSPKEEVKIEEEEKIVKKEEEEVKKEKEEEKKIEDEGEDEDEFLDKELKIEEIKEQITA